MWLTDPKRETPGEVQRPALNDAHFSFMHTQNVYEQRIIKQLNKDNIYKPPYTYYKILYLGKAW